MRSIRLTANKRAAAAAKKATRTTNPKPVGVTEDLAAKLQAMDWRPLQKKASKAGVLKRGMGRDEIVKALTEKAAS